MFDSQSISKSLMIPRPAYQRERHGLATARHPRQGAVLVVVLVAVVLLSLAAYSFTGSMVSEMGATSMFRRQASARLLAESGVEWTAAILGRRNQEPQNLFHDPNLWAGVLVQDAEEDHDRGRFSMVAPDLRQPELNTVRYGLVDESTRLNVNTLLAGDLDDEARRDRLMLLPEITIEIADALLDWLDEDEEPRRFGAENEYYGTLAAPYQAGNGPLIALDDLLSVRGITHWHLYGEDANRNGLLDPSENDGEASFPLDDADGVLWRGWSVYLTVDSAESNLQSDGTPRIDANQEDLAQLYDDLAALLDEEKALFITAFRLFGPAEQGISEEARERPSGGNRAGGAGATGGAPSGGSGQSRGGLELGGGGQTTITSHFDLIDAEVEATINGESKTLRSPWSSNGNDLEATLPALLDGLTMQSGDRIPGRININAAPRQVLLMVPGIDESLADSIVGRQQPEAAVEMSTGPSLQDTAGWLLVDGLVKLPQMQSLAPYITGRGDVFRAHVVGHFDAGPVSCRLDALIDATGVWPQVISLRELSELGSFPLSAP